MLSIASAPDAHPGLLLRQLIALDMQAAILAVFVLMLALVCEQFLRGRLPVWRKGLWISAMLLPLALLAIAAVLPHSAGWWLPAHWMHGTTGDSIAASEESSLLAIATALYVAWIALNLLLEIADLLRMRTLLRRACPASDPRVIAVYTHLVRSMRCTRVPQLVHSSEAASPFITGGIFRGMTIVLPTTMTDLPSRALRAVLAHELAHGRAGDPWVQRAIGALRCLLPLTWLCGLMGMRLFWEDAAEQTSDLRAIRGTGLNAHDYAQTLKDLALAEPTPQLALGFASPLAHLAPKTRAFARSLLRRLGALRFAEKWSEALASYGATAARAAALGTVLWLLAAYSPLHEVLQEPRPATALAIADRDAAPAPADASLRQVEGKKKPRAQRAPDVNSRRYDKYLTPEKRAEY